MRGRLDLLYTSSPSAFMLLSPPDYPPNGSVSAPSYRHTRAEPTSREGIEHAYHLTGSKAKPWASLKLKSTARSADALPVFMEGNVIRGRVELNGLKKDNIVEVAIVVRNLCQQFTKISLTVL